MLRPTVCLTQEKAQHAANTEAAFEERLQQLTQELQVSEQAAESKQAAVTDLQDELAAAHASNESLAAKLQVCETSLIVCQLTSHCRRSVTVFTVVQLH